MPQCLCLKNDGNQCTRQAKINSQFCWQHHKCQNIATISSQEVKNYVKKKKPLPQIPGPKKNFKKKPLPSLPITVTKMC